MHSDGRNFGYEYSRGTSSGSSASRQKKRKRDDEYQGSRSQIHRINHWATAMYITVIWGANLMYILEALILGMALLRTSTRRRICYVNQVPHPMKLLLSCLWEIREFEHLDLSEMKRTGASKRLSSVYSKLQAWSWLAGEAEVAVMLDTDLYVRKSLDSAFYKLGAFKIAGAFRGRGNFRLDTPRPPASIKTYNKVKRGGGGGGINGGVVVFRPSAQEAERMLERLKSYVPPDNSGGEQDYLSEYFGLKAEIAQLDVALNFQVHQLALTAVHDEDEGRWLSLVNRPDEIACFHFSAIPKPSNLLLGDITEESCGWMWKDFQEYAGWYTDDDNDLKDRVTAMAIQIYDYNRARSHLGTSSCEERHDTCKQIAADATHGYINEWFHNCWPNLLRMIYEQLMVQACQPEEGEVQEICKYCGNEWAVIGCPQHVLFSCPHIQHVAYESWKQFGPGTLSNIRIPASLWVHHVRQIGANPFQIKTGITLQIKLAYLACLVEAYEDTNLMSALQSTRHESPSLLVGKDVMNEYKRLSRSKSNGDMAVAFDRLTKSGR